MRRPVGSRSLLASHRESEVEMGTKFVEPKDATLRTQIAGKTTRKRAQESAMLVNLQPDGLTTTTLSLNFADNPWI